MFFLWINEKDNFFSISRTLTLTISFFEKQNLEQYSRSAEMSRCDKLILGVCLLRPVFLSDMLSHVIGVLSKYSADSALSNCQSNSA